MSVYGYIRVSTNQQDVDSQKLALTDYAVANRMRIEDFISVKCSSRKSEEKRCIDQLFKLQPNDILLITELSRLSREISETFVLINKLIDKGIKLIFIKQPELSTTGSMGKIAIAIHAIINETIRDQISFRTKQGMKLARLKGKQLGLKKGQRKRNTIQLIAHQDEINSYLKAGVNLKQIYKLIEPKLEYPLSLAGFYNYMKNLDKQ